MLSTSVNNVAGIPAQRSYATFNDDKYTIQQTAPGIALDVAFVLAGDGRAWLCLAHRCRAAVETWDFVSPQSPNPLSPAKNLRKSGNLDRKKKPKYPKIYLKKNRTSWCLKMGYTGIPENDWKQPFFARGAVLLGDTRRNACYALCHVRPVPSHASKVRVAWRFTVSRFVFLTAVASAHLRLKQLAAAPFHHRFQGGVALKDQLLRFFKRSRNSENFRYPTGPTGIHWYPLVLQGSQVNVTILFTTHVEGLAVNTQTWQRKWICERNDVEILRKHRDFRFPHTAIESYPNNIPIIPIPFLFYPHILGINMGIVTISYNHYIPNIVLLVGY